MIDRIKMAEIKRAQRQTQDMEPEVTTTPHWIVT